MKEEVRKHSKYSPSKLFYIATCPGFEDRKDDILDNEDADEEDVTFHPATVGTRIHKALEEESKDDLLSPLEVKIYEKGMQNIEFILDELSGKWDVPKESMNIVKELVLGPVYLEGDDKNPIFGTADMVVFHQNKAAIIDHKTGQIPVSSPESNPQLICYGYLLMETHPEIEEVHLYINQPTLWDGVLYGMMHRTSPWIPQDEDSVMSYLEAKPYIQAAWTSRAINSENPMMYKSSPEVCPYCARLSECRKITRDACKLAGTCYDDRIKLLDLESINYSDVVKNPEILGKLMDFAKFFEGYTDLLKKKIRGLISAGVDIPGWKVSSGGKRIRFEKASFVDIAVNLLGKDKIVHELTSIPSGKFLPLMIQKKLEDSGAIELGLDVEDVKKTPEFKEAKEAFIEDLVDTGIILEVNETSRLLKDKGKKSN
jgi:hypothetical protein